MIEFEGDAAVIDSPRRDALLSFLLDSGISRISTLLVSHADMDHISGILVLLQDERWSIDSVFVNPEQCRATEVWDSFKIALRAAQEQGTVVHVALNTEDPGVIGLGEVQIEILSPEPVSVLAGPGGRVGSRRYTANGLSAVCRILYGGEPRALLPGDLDSEGLSELVKSGKQAESAIVVFPHHGGLPGGDPHSFVNTLLDLTSPSALVYSIGSRFANPRSEIIDAVLESGLNVYIACTGLSVRCHPPESDDPNRPESCAGTVTVDLESGEWRYPRQDEHQLFISGAVRSPMCRVKPSHLAHIKRTR